MSKARLTAAIEAVLMVIDEPVSTTDLATAIEVPEQEVLAALVSLRDEYTDPRRPRGFELREVDGRWRVYSSPLFADVVGRFIVEGQSARLSQAALETLAVVSGQGSERGYGHEDPSRSRTNHRGRGNRRSHPIRYDDLLP